jgi:hypothetical protein
LDIVGVSDLSHGYQVYEESSRNTFDLGMGYQLYLYYSIGLPALLLSDKLMNFNLHQESKAAQNERSERGNPFFSLKDLSRYQPHERTGRIPTLGQLFE